MLTRLLISTLTLLALAGAAQAGGLHGVVTNTATQPIRGVAIDLFNGANALVASTTSGNDGGYAFVDVAQGTYRIEATPPSESAYGPASIPGVFVADDSEQDIVLVEIIEEWFITADLKRSNAGPPPGGYLYIDGTPYAATDGGYVATPSPLIEGAHSLRIYAEGNTSGDAGEIVREWFDAYPASINLTADTHYDLTLPTVAVTVRVKDDAGNIVRSAINMNQSWYASEVPTSVGPLAIPTTYNGHFQVYDSGADGEVTLHIPRTRAAQTVSFRVTPLDASNHLAYLDLTRGWAGDTTIDVVIPRKVDITGTILADDGLGGRVVPNARIYLEGSPSVWRYTDANGAWSDRTVPGPYNAWLTSDQAVVAANGDYYTAFFSAYGSNPPVSVAAGAHVDFLLPMVPVTFIIETTNGAAVPGAALSNTGWYPSTTPLTTAGHTFQVYQGALQVHSTGPDNSITVWLPPTAVGTSLTITVTPGAGSNLAPRTFTGLAWPTATTHTLRLKDKVDFTGTLKRTSGAVPSGARIHVTRSGYDQWHYPNPTTGAFSIKLDPEVYSIELYAGDSPTSIDDDNNPATPAEVKYAYFYAQPATLDLSAGGRNIDFVVPTKLLTIEVVDEAGQPIPNAAVSHTNAWWSAGAPVTIGGLDFTGLFWGLLYINSVGADGRATVELPPTDDSPQTIASLQASAAGFVTKTATQLSWNGLGPSTVTITLARVARFEGSLTFADGSSGGGGERSITLQPGGYSSAIHPTSGAFAIGNVPAGDYAVYINGWDDWNTSADGGIGRNYLELSSGSTRVTLTSGNTTQRALVLPSVPHTVTVVDTENNPVPGNTRVYAYPHNVREFETGGLTFTGRQDEDAYTGADHQVTYPALLPAIGAKFTQDAWPQAPFLYHRFADKDYPPTGNHIVRLSKAGVTGVVRRGNGTPFARVDGADTLRVVYRRSADNIEVTSSVLGALGEYGVALNAATWQTHVYNWHYNDDSPGPKYTRSYFDVWSTSAVAITGTSVRDLTLNTRQLTVRVLDRNGVPVPNATINIPGYYGEGNTTWQQLYGQADAHLGASGQATFTLPRTTANGQLISIQVTPPAGSGFKAFSLAKALRQDLVVTIILSLATNGTDPDNDGKKNDGDSSGVIGDHPCTAGQTTNCDDNCIGIANADQADFDGDGKGDACDPDDDGDGLGDDPDPNDTDTDADDDGKEDGVDNCPSIANAGQANADGDGQGDACDADDDNDGVADGNDNCALVANADQVNSDGAADGGDACDPDDDNDNLADSVDNCPTVKNLDQADADGDHRGDACECLGVSCNDNNACTADSCNPTSGACERVTTECQGDNTACNPGTGVCGCKPGWFLNELGACATNCADLDVDGACDEFDNCAQRANPDQADADQDGLGDECDLCDFDASNDVDHDLVCGDVDNCPGVANPHQENGDGDAQGDACDVDLDNDGVPDGNDNCPTVANANQANADFDARGDVCDPCPKDELDDGDGDGRCADVDTCPAHANPDQADQDQDGAGDVCDPCPLDPLDDADGDGRCANVDTCPLLSNPAQTDTDVDGRGDDCDGCPLDAKNDVDQDGLCGNVDNCPERANAGQEDSDHDQIGDVCDDCPALPIAFGNGLPLTENGASASTFMCNPGYAPSGPDPTCVGGEWMGVPTCSEVPCEPLGDPLHGAWDGSNQLGGSAALTCEGGFEPAAEDATRCVGSAEGESDWSPHPSGCRDVDECKSELDDCALHATCTNTVGSFTCACDAGWFGSGKSCCPDADEGGRWAFYQAPHVLVCGDMSGPNDIEGTLGVLGNLDLNGFSIALMVEPPGGSPQVQDPGEPFDVLWVGGILKATSGAVWGQAYYGQALSIDETVTFGEGAGTPIQGGTKRLEQLCNFYPLMSLNLASMDEAGGEPASVTPWGDIELVGHDPIQNVFQLDASDVVPGAQTSFYISAPAGSTVLVNVTGSTASIVGGGFYLTGVGPEDVLVNFPEASTLELSQLGFLASMLAPFANVHYVNGAIRGAMAVGALTGDLEHELGGFGGAINGPCDDQLWSQP